VARQLPRTLRLHNEVTIDKGAVKLYAAVSGDAEKDRQTVHATGSLTDLVAHRGDHDLTLRDPATFAFQLERTPSSSRLEQFTVQTPLLTARGTGDLDQGIRLTAMVDMSKATEQLRDWVEMGNLTLAGQGAIDTCYRRAADTFELTADANFKALGADGLPTVGTVHRDHVSAKLAVRGTATASGFPTRADDFSLTGQADTEQLHVSAQRQRTTGDIKFNTDGEAQFTVNGGKQEATGSLRGYWVGTISCSSELP
jgi:translocation and assembly module TamB